MIIKLFSIFFCINSPYRVLHLYTSYQLPLTFVGGLYVLPIYEFLTVELNQLFVLYIFSPLLIKYLSSPPVHV
nr:MAG TPA: hypothetical protein [Caudoviricetes sp.]